MKHLDHSKCAVIGTKEITGYELRVCYSAACACYFPGLLSFSHVSFA